MGVFPNSLDEAELIAMFCFWPPDPSLIHSAKDEAPMPKNTKQSSPSLTHIAAQTLKDPNASAIQKSLAGSVLSQSHTQKETGADMEAVASQALKNPNSSDITKTLAGSVVSQANKKR